jgi:hypothetical protein
VEDSIANPIDPNLKMKIARIISMANAKVRLQFLAMARSLRATGCDLPLFVIPYDDSRFPLPENAQWIEDEGLFAVIRESAALPITRKYLALTQTNSAYFDSDIIHLRDPRKWLEPVSEDAFAVADTEWLKARWTFTPETRELYQSKSTLWLLDNFNSGFFAHAAPMVEMAQIEEFFVAHEGMVRGQTPTRSEQEGANFLVHQSGRRVVNLCLPPQRMESTMACDYAGNFEAVMRGPNAPAFMHYAGPGRNLDAAPARLISEHLTESENAEMRAEFERRKQWANREGKWPLWVRVARRLVSKVDPRFRLQWNESFSAVR